MNSFTLKPIASAPFHQPLLPSPHHHRPFFSRPISSLSFRTHPTSPSSFSYTFSPIKASSNSSNPSENKNPKSIISNNALNPTSLVLSFMKTSLIATAAAAAIFFTRFYILPVKPAVGSPKVATLETTAEGTVSNEEREKFLEEQLVSRPNDIQLLKDLMEIKITSGRMQEGISIVERLIELEPNEVEWPLMKSHLLAYTGELELAKNGFNEIIAKDPFRVEAYHGLVTVVSQYDDSPEELRGIERRIDEAMKLCKKDNKKTDLRDFQLLLAQIRVIQGKYNDALKVYEELIKEEPRDFRPYLCQGIIYTLLRNKKEADKNFEKYQRLVPKGHPYTRYFEDNMIATKVFAQKVENERAESKS